MITGTSGNILQVVENMTDSLFRWENHLLIADEIKVPPSNLTNLAGSRLHPIIPRCYMSLFEMPLPLYQLDYRTSMMASKKTKIYINVGNVYAMY